MLLDEARLMPVYHRTECKQNKVNTSLITTILFGTGILTSQIFF